MNMIIKPTSIRDKRRHTSVIPSMHINLIVPSYIGDVILVKTKLG